jgi:G:T-mismatch repair DNA endonuclease (very short patch repair protein)
MLELMLTPEEQAAYNAHKRRAINRHVAWKRHDRAARTQEATGRLGRSYNKLEAILARLMDEAGIDYEWQFRLGRYVYDFKLPNRVLIEVNGTWWLADPRFHSPSRLSPTQQRNLQRDAVKAEFATLCGYRVKVVWEKDLRNGHVDFAELAK